MVITKKTASGATLVMEKIPHMKSVAVGLWARAGAVNETPDKLGISHYIEHMMFKGTDRRNTKQLAEDIDKIGGQINAFTGKETTCYYVKSLDSHMEEACDVLFDLFLNSTFDEVEMEKEKDVVYEEINMHEDSPEDDIHDVLYGQVFKNSPLATPVLGTKDTLKGMSRQMLFDYIEENYSAERIVVSVAGNFDEDKVIKMVEDQFKNLKKRPELKADYSKIYTPSQVFKKKDIEQAHVCIGTKGLSISDDYYYALSTLNNIIGGSMSSRLFQSIREERGMAYSVYSYMSSYVNDGIFAVYAGVSPNRVEEVTECIVKELKLLKKDGITDDELYSSKEQLKSSHIFGMEGVSSRMFSLGRSQILLGKTYTQEEILDKISKVDKKTIGDMIDKISDISSYSGALLGKTEKELLLS